MLVLSKCLYGAESWITNSNKVAGKFHSLIINLYKRLARVGKDSHCSDEDVLVAVALPSPEELLRRARLRYFVTLVHTDLPDLWATLGRDNTWCRLIEDDMIWMWRQLHHASNLPDPREKFEYWLYLAQSSPRYWKRLVRRASMHCILQRQRLHKVKELHLRVLQRVEPLVDNLDIDPIAEVRDTPTFGCMMCQKKCRNSAGEAAHMCKVHGRTSQLRILYDQPTCGACLKHFHTMAKMKAHLYYSSACRETLQSRNQRCAVVPGTGSKDDLERVKMHDRLLPPLTGHGPHLAPVRRRVDTGIDEAFHQFTLDLLFEVGDLQTLRSRLVQYCSDVPLSWTIWRRTLLFLVDMIAAEDTDLFDFDLAGLQKILLELCSPCSWPFLTHQQRTRNPTTLKMLEERCVQFEAQLQVSPPVFAPCSFGRHRVVLHAFSGRRRIGDLQFFLDAMAQRQTQYVLHVVSMDVVVDEIKGNAMDRDTWEFWISAIRQKHVIAMVAGPPCESWSCARAAKTSMEDHTDWHQPRIIRTREQLWGLDCASLREIVQLYTGNTLLSFSLVVFIEICFVNGFAILEHPGEPVWDADAASIWRLPVISMILSFPNVQKIRFCQGLLGAATPKPTNLMTANLPKLLLDLHACRVRTELPRTAAIGKDDQGRWKTTALKEYPPAMCQGLAVSLARGFAHTGVNHDVPEPTAAQLSVYESMNVKKLGSHIGADFSRP